MLDQTKNILIGVFILTALAIIIYIILFLHPSMGNEGQTLKVRFSNIDKVGIGTRVLFAGRPVGEVVNIQEVEGARLEQEIRKGEIYIYELTLKIDSGIDVYTSDEISAKTAGLLGEKSVSITPQPPKPGEHLVKVTDQVVYATNPPSVDEAIKEFNNLAKKAQQALDEVNDDLKNLRDKDFWGHLASTAHNLSDITKAFNKPEDLSTIVSKTRSLTEGLASLEQKVSNAWPKIEETINNFNESSARLKSGEGTIGRLIAKEDLYLQFTSVLSKAETLMDDINHFGLLFQNDKTWQRLRARRVNLMRQLSTPQEFHNFFNDEIDQISTSLSRVSMILQDTTNEAYLPIICSPEFTRIFADLLRRVTDLGDHLKLFDQQVMEKREKDCDCLCLPLPPIEMECSEPPFLQIK